MTVIGNRFTPPFAGRRPDGPTPAPPGPDISFDSVVEANGRVNVTLRINGAVIVDTLAFDWGDGTREQLQSLVATHAYHDGGVYELRAIARSNTGRESVNSIRLQVLEGAPPIPDPVADFTSAPAAPTTATPVTLDAAISTPAEFIDRWEWKDVLNDGDWAAGPSVRNLGLLAAGSYVWALRVHVIDGRWSEQRNRGWMVTAAEEPEPDPETEPEPEPDPEPEPEP